MDTKQLTIDWGDLELAFEQMDNEMSSLDEISNYLDTTNGQVVVVDEFISDAVRGILEDLDEADAEESSWTDEDLRATETYRTQPDFVKPILLSAFHLEYGAPTDRFKQIPRFDSRDAFAWMEEFANSLDDVTIRNRLTTALCQRKPFRNFREIIGSDRRLQRQWQHFEANLQRERIVEWLHCIGIEPLNPDESTFNPPPLPNLRSLMFDEVLQFVSLASGHRGVMRIALIGSLTTDKEFPKDIELLVTVRDDCDLTPLAAWGRKIAGKMASHVTGVDVFLANPNGESIGRTCSWKKCEPGIRSSCDANNCGLRDYLHDDLSSIELDKTQIQDPPVLLWPEATATPGTPTDVLEKLVNPLRR